MAPSLPPFCSYGLVPTPQLADQRSWQQRQQVGKGPVRPARYQLAACEQPCLQ